MQRPLDHGNGYARLRLSGDLRLAQSSALYRELQALADDPKTEAVELDLSGVLAIDSAGAVTILLGKELLDRAGKSLSLRHLTEAQQNVLQSMAGLAAHGPETEPAASVLEQIGERAIVARSNAREFVKMLARAGKGAGRWLIGKERKHTGALIELSVTMGANAVYIVSLLGLLIGVVLAFQAAYQLRQFGAQLFMAEVVSIGMVREFGAVITAVILSGRSGAAIAAELGTMSINEELDALRSMGIDPVRYLVPPRLLAMSLVTPLLSMWATAAGIAGGVAIAGVVGVPPLAVYHRMTDSLVPSDFVLGFTKSLLFGWIIALVGCFMGLRTRGGAHSVGHNTTRAVVVSILLIVITDSAVTTVWTLSHAS
jgi:phospholipid/cholesterol/gamma-HCH transport system permease protein